MFLLSYYALRYPDTYLKWSIGIAIRIGYGDGVVAPW
jgi:hypothetical protein